MVAALATVVACGIVLPHAIRLQAVHPTTAVALWLVSLSLRAAAGVAVAIAILLFLPASGAFHRLKHWCGREVLPLIDADVGFEGHAVGGVVTVVPALLLGASLAWILFGLVRAGLTVHRLLAREGLGRGPQEAIIVGGAEVMLAAAGFARPRLVVSAGALLELDDAELEAALAHEQGHIVRRHRWLLVYGEVCRGLGGFVPGARAAQRGLAFHLERDADRWAARGHDRAALASAICKAGLSRTTPTLGYAMLAEPQGAARRVDELLGEAPARRRLQAWSLNGAALVGAALLIGLASLTPATIAAGHTKRDAYVASLHCEP